MKKRSSMRVESYGISDIGLVRENNEDVWLSMPRYRFFALADGMGGQNGGEIAAKEAIGELSESIKYRVHPQKKAKLPTRDLIYHLRSAIDQANMRVFSLGNEKKFLKGMGTTLCCLYLYEDSVIYAHVGDSRIYRYRDRELKQLTQDHCLRYDLKHPKKHIITRAIGTSTKVEPEIASVTAKKGDVFFMCTDGLSDFVSLADIETLLQRKRSLKYTAKCMIDAAKKRGSGDNITTLFVKIR